MISKFGISSQVETSKEVLPVLVVVVTVTVMMVVVVCWFAVGLEDGMGQTG